MIRQVKRVSKTGSEKRGQSRQKDPGMATKILAAEMNAIYVPILEAGL